MRYARFSLMALRALGVVLFGASREAPALTVDTAIPVSPRPQAVAVYPAIHRVNVAPMLSDFHQISDKLISLTVMLCYNPRERADRRWEGCAVCCWELSRNAAGLCVP